MFQKLRRKFLILNISIITFVMAAAFAAIYISAYTKAKAENTSKLESLGATTSIEASGSHGTVDYFVNDTIFGTPISHIFAGDGVESISYYISSEDSRIVSILVNEGGEVQSVDVSNYYAASDETFEEAAQMAWSQKRDYSVIKADGTEWMYAIRQIRQFELPSSGTIDLNELAGESSGLFKILLLDVTASNASLRALMLTLLGTGGAMLLVIVAISFFFTNRAIAPIAEAWDKQRQFIADASHELKTPITIIKSNTGVLLANKEQTVESQMKWLERITTGTDRMARLVSELLDIAEMDEAGMAENAQSFDLSEIVAETAQAMEAAAAQKGIAIKSAIEPNVVAIGNAGKIEEALAILLDNAVKYTDEAGSIDVSLIRSHGQAICSVRNSGQGIPAEDLPKVFNRFYRTDASHNSETGGSGLGLSIAKSIMESAGGSIKAESKPGEYTAFTFALKSQSSGLGR